MLGLPPLVMWALIALIAWFLLRKFGVLGRA